MKLIATYGPLDMDNPQPAITVHAGSANVDGITFKFFSPTPSPLKK